MRELTEEGESEDREEGTYPKQNGKKGFANSFFLKKEGIALMSHLWMRYYQYCCFK